MKLISVTTGDVDGIGFEVTDKALADLPAHPGRQLLVWKHSECPQRWSRKTLNKYSITSVRSLSEAFQVKSNSRQIIEIKSPLNPAEWVRVSAEAALKGDVHALCTGPLSKTSPGAQGGHTGIFRELVNTPLYMFFLGSKFHVLLLTDHQPLLKFYHQLSSERICTAAELLKSFFSQHQKSLTQKPFALLGINPHAGEKGLLGSEEESVLIPALKKLGRKYKIDGPIPPDAAFLPSNWKKYSAYIACYHDQGLIPFKMIHGHDSGVHMTLGLPFIRTSVDHGTAKEIFGKGKANAGSMRDALKWALKLTASR